MSTVLSPNRLNMLGTPGAKPEEPVLDPTPVLSPASTPRAPRPEEPVEQQEAPTTGASESICYVCRRRLGSAEMLRKHEELSALHQKNLKIAKQTCLRRRQEMRQDVMRIRHVVGSAEDPDLVRLETELGHTQESIEEQSRTRIHAEVEVEVGDFSLAISGTSWMGNKSSNEDRMLLRMDLGPGVAGILLADGHCGDSCADFLVTHLPLTIKTHLDATAGTVTAECVGDAIVEGFRATDAAFMDQAVAHQIPSGSTAIVAVFFTDVDTDNLSCVMGHVGDSRGLVLVDPARGVQRVTEDHKPDRADEHARLSAAGGHVVDVGGVWRVFTPNVVCIGGRSLQWGLAVSRAFGDLALKRPSVIVSAEPEISDSVLVKDGSVVVLACDGIFDVLSDEETMQSALAEGPGDILRKSYAKLSDDNLTAVVCRVRERRLPAGPKPHGTDAPTNELRRRGSAVEPEVKKRRHTDQGAPEPEDGLGELQSHRRSSEAPEMITPSQQF